VALARHRCAAFPHISGRRSLAAEDSWFARDVGAEVHSPLFEEVAEAARHKPDAYAHQSELTR
jgi:hypothetical protein